jgi:putative NIF3 family GTP cyclohydrolase 1 type 2
VQLDPCRPDRPEGISPLDKENESAQWIGTCGVFDVPEEGPSLPEKLAGKVESFWVRDYNVPKTVTGLAIVGGSGGDLWPTAKARGCELFITADMKYHQVMEAVETVWE